MKNIFKYNLSISVIFTVLILLFTSSCSNGGALNHMIEPEGLILQVKSTEKNTDILVRFNTSKINSYYDLWIKGSDTCKVGQIVKLK